MKFMLLPSLLVLLVLSACKPSPNEPPAAEAAAPAAGEAETEATADAATGQAEEDVATSQALNELFESYFERVLEMNPVYASFIGDNRYNDRFSNNIGPEYLAESKALEEEYLAAINAFDPVGLEGQDLLSYQIFKRNRENSLEGFKYPGHLMPVSQFFSTPNFFVQLGSGASVHPFNTVKDYDDFLSRADGFVAWMNQARENMREGMQNGVVRPRILMEKAMPQLAAQLVDSAEESLFYQPVTNMPEDFGEEDRARLTAAYTAAIGEKIIPAYRMLHDFIRDEYLPAARDTVGQSELPNGEAWYAYLVANTTTTDFSPDYIHQVGLDEVKRIHGEMQKVMDEVGFEGTLDEFFEHLNTDPQFYYTEREQLIEGYNALREDVHAKALKLFHKLPEADYEIRAVEPFREKSAAGGSYMRASPDGSRPGVFYVNTYDLSARPKWAMESLFLHEAVPGHHFQGAGTLELEGLPRFRQYGGFTAYSEGWGLYAESLGKEMGVYQDPYQYFGALNAELWRAIRLVVDTGLHAKGWSRQDVLDFMYANSATKEARAVAEAERYMAIPSQALAYKIGQLKISALRAKAEEQLGDGFDVKEFHDQILRDGPLPLDVLEAKIDQWIARVQG